tara:strand:+ start:797 stop:1267 length:471 start_codon:yes stop_codon:yes gene_type:complete
MTTTITGALGIDNIKAATGAVLQVVSGTKSSGVTNSTGTYVDTGLQATITPTSNSSKILVIVDQQGCKATSMQTGDINIKLQRNGSDAYKFALGYFYSGSSSEFRTGISGHYLDSPSSTSATIYKTVFRPNDGGSCAVQNDNANTVSTITLMEIAG